MLGLEPPAGAPPEVAPPGERVRARGLYSDVLFQPHLCAAVPLRRRWLALDNVPRCAGLTAAEFAARFERPNAPCILTDVVPTWQASRLWSDDYLASALGHVTVYAGGYPFAMRDYLRYAHAVRRDDAPLYLFDRDVLGATPLGAHYAPPPQLPNDYFSVLDGDDDDRDGGGGRPAYRWLIVGPPRSGSTWHKDPKSVRTRARCRVCVCAS